MWRSVAETAMNRHEYNRSVAAYQKALAIQPDDGAILNQLGYAAAYAGDLPGAVRALDRYQGLRPADPNPLDSLGDVNVLAGRLREAENFYLQAAKKAPDFLGGGDFRKAAMARLMSGDVEGATALDKQYLDYRMAARDPLVDYYRAEWVWITGKRKEGYQRLEAFANATAGGPLREAAAQAYGELAVWSVVLGNRGAAQTAAEKAGASQIGTIARFLAQPSASPDEWEGRANRIFPEPAQKQVKQSALVYSLLSDRQFGAASQILKTMYETGTPGGEEVPFLLAWCDLETGRAKEAAGLLRFNPIPPSSGVHPFQVFYFPRVFYLRGRIAMLAGQPDAAAAQFRLFRQLSGDAPLIWGEEGQAR
jgi:tetratricopeptide (TPR) repeat protein